MNKHKVKIFAQALAQEQQRHWTDKHKQSDSEIQRDIKAIAKHIKNDRG